MFVDGILAHVLHLARLSSVIICYYGCRRLHICQSLRYYSRLRFVQYI